MSVYMRRRTRAVIGQGQIEGVQIGSDSEGERKHYSKSDSGSDGVKPGPCLVKMYASVLCEIAISFFLLGVQQSMQEHLSPQLGPMHPLSGANDHLFRQDNINGHPAQNSFRRIMNDHGLIDRAYAILSQHQQPKHQR